MTTERSVRARELYVTKRAELLSTTSPEDGEGKREWKSRCNVEAHAWSQIEADREASTADDDELDEEFDEEYHDQLDALNDFGDGWEASAQWVACNLETNVKVNDAPSRLAWSMLRWAKKDRTKFWGDIGRRVMEREMGASGEDDEDGGEHRSIEAIDGILNTLDRDAVLPSRT